MIPENFGYGQDQEVFRGSVRKFLEKEAPAEKVRQWMETEKGDEPAIYRQMAELGWLGLVIPEEHDGLGLPTLDLAVLCEEMGRKVLPSPFFGTLLASVALAYAGDEEQKKRYLPRLASGEISAALAVSDENGSWSPEHGKSTAAKTADGIKLQGKKLHVTDAESAGLILATVKEAEGPSLFAIELPAEGVEVVPETLVDATRRSAQVLFNGVIVQESARIGDPGGAADAIREAYLKGWIALAGEAVGGAMTLLEITVDYAKVREQFGKPIGAFQAVKFPLVDMMIAAESARSLLYAAAAAVDHEPERAELLCRMAKAACSESYAEEAAKSVILHGGIGFTWECDVHLYFKRAQWIKFALGDPAWHRRKIGELLA